MTEEAAIHLPNLPAAGELTRTDRICSAALPARSARGGIKRVFHEAGPVAYTGPGEVLIRCIHCAREFENS